MSYLDNVSRVNCSDELAQHTLACFDLVIFLIYPKCTHLIHLKNQGEGKPVVIVDKGELERELISIDENLVRKDLRKIETEGHLRRGYSL